MFTRCAGGCIILYVNKDTPDTGEGFLRRYTARESARECTVFFCFSGVFIVGIFEDLQGTQNKIQVTRESKRKQDTSDTQTRAAAESVIENAPARVTEKPRRGKRKTEKITVEVLTAAGVPAEYFPVSVDDISRLLPLWVDEWTRRENVPDIRQVKTPLLFAALCTYIGKTYIKPSRILKDDKNKRAAGACVASTCNRYDPVSVAAAYDIFVEFCNVCGQVPFQRHFALFCGISIMYVREYIQELTSAGINLAKKTRDIELESIRETVSRDPVGRLAILNNEYYNHGVSGVAESASEAALPVVNSFALIDGARLD